MLFSLSCAMTRWRNKYRCHSWIGGRLLEAETQAIQQSDLAPIRGIPEEILGEIFCYAAYVEPVPHDNAEDQIEHRNRYALSPDTPPLVLFRVCKTWRRVAFQTPEIFKD